MPSPPDHDGNEASSSTAAEKALSSLRARLRSEDIPPCPEPASMVVDQENHICAKLRAVFSGNNPGRVDASSDAKSANLAGAGPPNSNPFFSPTCLVFSYSQSLARSPYADIFALYGQEIYNLSVKAVQSAHEATSAKVSAFEAQAAVTSAHTTHLYNNISYPLSATRCQSDVFPSASLGRHIRTLNKNLSAAEAELGRLNDEWKRCVAEEAAILSERADRADGEVARRKMGELMARIDDVVRRRGGGIDLLDEEYRDLLWTESNRMMQAMMAD